MNKLAGLPVLFERIINRYRVNCWCCSPCGLLVAVPGERNWVDGLNGRRAQCLEQVCCFPTQPPTYSWHVSDSSVSPINPEGNSVYAESCVAGQPSYNFLRKLKKKKIYFICSMNPCLFRFLQSEFCTNYNS